MFDCGDTIHKALGKYEQDKSNPFKGGTDPMSAGNGGLMRLAPAILAARSEAQAAEFAAELAAECAAEVADPGANPGSVCTEATEVASTLSATFMRKTK